MVHYFLLPFGSFEAREGVRMLGMKIIQLSTPFWEFHALNSAVLSISTKSTFYSLLGVSISFPE